MREFLRHQIDASILLMMGGATGTQWRLELAERELHAAELALIAVSACSW
jgi:hypothetical protein